MASFLQGTSLIVVKWKFRERWMQRNENCGGCLEGKEGAEGASGRKRSQNPQRIFPI